MTPIMVRLFDVNPTTAVGIDMAASVAMKPFGAVVHHCVKTVRWDLVKWLLPTAVSAGHGCVHAPAAGRGISCSSGSSSQPRFGLGLAVVGMFVRPRWPGAARARSTTRGCRGASCPRCWSGRWSG